MVLVVPRNVSFRAEAAPGGGTRRFVRDRDTGRTLAQMTRADELARFEAAPAGAGIPRHAAAAARYRRSANYHYDDPPAGPAA